MLAKDVVSLFNILTRTVLSCLLCLRIPKILGLFTFFDKFSSYSKIMPNFCQPGNMSIRKIPSFPFINLKNLSFTKQRKKMESEIKTEFEL